MDSERSYPVEQFFKKTIVVAKESEYNKSMMLISKDHLKYIDKILLSRGMIIDRIEKLAQDIVKDYYDKTVYFLVVMKGAVVFSSHLAEKINDILKNDIKDTYSMKYFFEYISSSSYENDNSTGNVKINADTSLLEKIKNNHVIIVEDIYDSGFSMVKLREYINKCEPTSLKTAVLFQKMNKKNLKYNYDIDYLGFLIPNEFVVGFGLDYNEEFRQLNHVCSINEFGIESFKIKK